jgi:hypothetical protein
LLFRDKSSKITAKGGAYELWIMRAEKTEEKSKEEKEISF